MDEGRVNLAAGALAQPSVFLALCPYGLVSILHGVILALCRVMLSRVTLFTVSIRGMIIDQLKVKK